MQVNGIPILDKVRKLLAKAEDPACTPAEAEAFTAKAAELIAKYGVDAALLAETDPERDPVGDRVVDVPAPYATEKCTLLSEVATELRCRAVRRLRRGSAGKEFSMHLFGHAADLERVEVLFTSLLVQAMPRPGRSADPGSRPCRGLPAVVADRICPGRSASDCATAEHRAAQAGCPRRPPPVGGAGARRPDCRSRSQGGRGLPEVELRSAAPAGGWRHAGRLHTAGQQADLGGVRLRQRSRRSVGG